jgi:NAD(P)-dependent dehydrogenase (short-subunit alcohol dehydrogenase family)
MTQELTGKVAIVTGAGRGLGREIAAELSETGADVVVASRTRADLDSFVDEVEAAGRQALAVPTDVTEEADVDAMVAAAMERFGRIDIVVNNSGIVDSVPLLEQEPEAWDRVVSTNLRGTYLVTRAAGRHLVRQGSGKVINIASNFALMGIANHAAYSASKAAVIAFTRAMAIEWARHSIQVNAIAPGYFETDLNADMRADDDMTSRVLRAIPIRRMGSPTELRPWISLLAGSASDFMTGEVIVIDGGQSVP